MKKLHILLLFSFCISCTTGIAQISFETHFLPDSNVVGDITGNQQGDLFVSSYSISAIRNDKLFKSSDHGQTWDTVFEFGYLNAGSVCINSAGDIYTLAQWHNDTSSSIFKSNDNGLSWSGRYIPNDNQTVNKKLYLSGNDTLYVTQYSGLEIRILRSFSDGLEWDTLFIRIGGTSELIGGLAIGNDGVYYVGIYGFLDGQGGVFRTLDDGETWELFGLGGDMITDIEYNSNGDLFITSMGGAHAGGLYAVFANENVITPIYTGPSLSGLVINSNDEIFAGNFWAGYLYHSSDNGQTYEWITTGLPNAGLYNLFSDQQQYLYTIVQGVGNIFWGSIDPTVTSTHVIERKPINVFPNPCNDLIMGILPAMLNEIVEYKIFSYTGSYSKTGQLIVNNGRFVIDVSDLPRGLYLLELLSDEPFSGKIIKQ